MFDRVVGFVGNAWAAYSFWATIGGSVGLILLLLAVFGSAVLPGFVRKPLICAGTAFIVVATVYQAGSTHGAHEASERAARLAQAAESRRGINAAIINRKQAAQVAHARANEAAERVKLQGIIDDLRKDKNRDRVCVDAGTAARLRQLRGSGTY